MTLCAALIAGGCSGNTATKIRVAGAGTPQFSDIEPSKRKKVSFPENDETKEIKLDAEVKFDGIPIESRDMTLDEWNELKATLSTASEVKVNQLSALSARLRCFDGKSSEPIYWMWLYWTSESGDVYFEDSKGWYKAPDRAKVLQAIRGRN